jgi:hypothetical protein
MRLGMTRWGFALGYREAVDLARRAEDAGFHSLFMVESVLASDGVTTAAMIAARTSRLLIGTNIANVCLRHPVMLAAAAVAIDDGTSAAPSLRPRLPASRREPAPAVEARHGVGSRAPRSGELGRARERLRGVDHEHDEREQVRGAAARDLHRSVGAVARLGLAGTDTLDAVGRSEALLPGEHVA